MNASNYKEPNTCARRGCNKPGKHFIELTLIKRFGWFCDDHIGELESNSLIVNKSSISLGMGEGQIVDIQGNNNDIKKQEGLN